MQGFAVNDAEVTGITGAYQLSKKILLHEDSAIDTYSSAIPNSCYFSHLDLQFLQDTDDGGSQHSKVSCFLSWDSAGNDPVTGEASGNPGWTGLTQSDSKDFLSLSVVFDVWINRPEGQTTSGKVYLHVRGNSGSATMTLKKARLHWVTRPSI